MEAEIADAGTSAQPTPGRSHPGVAQRIALAPHAACARPLCDEGEDEFRMMPAQGPQDVGNLRRDGNADPLAALAELHDLLALNLAPLQQTFAQPQPRCTGKGEERGEVVARDRVE